MLSEESEVEDGILYIVSTPIGNLADITFRAVQILTDADLIAAEDTRRASILLNHYKIKAETTSYYDYNKERKTPYLITQLKQGKSIALISDAGTPGISDPAFYLIREAIREHIHITTIPGATAFVPALILSGFPINRFIFEGFLPFKKGRKKRIENYKEEQRTIVLYESPKRILKTTLLLFEILGDREICIVRELTKMHEECYRGSLSELCSGQISIKQKGEFVIIMKGKQRSSCENK